VPEDGKLYLPGKIPLADLVISIGWFISSTVVPHPGRTKAFPVGVYRKILEGFSNQ
jgi:hypothetical protein